MKSIFAVLVISAFAAISISAGVVPDDRYDGPVYEMTPIEETASSDQQGLNEEASNALEPHSRERRFTCDLFSFSSQWVTPNHSACAMKCIGMRRRGGTCRNGRCVCRNDRW